MKGLYRDRWDRKIAGVCGGLGQYLKIDSTIIRLLMVIICIFTAVLPLMILYILAWMLIPLGSPIYIQYKCNKLYRPLDNRRIGGVCGGIADMLHIHPTVVRVVVLSLMIITGVFPILITYIIGIAIIPEKPK